MIQIAPVAGRLVLPIVVALAGCLYAGVQAAATPSSFRIRGIVTNALTGEPVPRAEVAIAPAQNSAAARTLVTDKDGSFVFPNLRAGKYSLQAEARGFSLQAFNQHEEFSTAIVVGPNLDSDNIQFRLQPDSTVVGTISDEENEPVANAQVMLITTSMQRGTTTIRELNQATSDDQGHYRFSRVRPGRFYIAVSAQPWYAERSERMVSLGASSEDGSAGEELSTLRFASSPPSGGLNVVYPLTYYPGATDSGAAKTLEIKPGDRAVADVSLASVPALHLRVLEPGSDTAKPVLVQLFQYLLGGGFPRPLPAETRFGKGVVVVDGIPPGRFLLTAQMPGANPTAREKVVEIFADTETDLSDTSAVPAITGVVVSDHGKPLSRRVFVRLSNHSSGQLLVAQSSAKGEFEIKSEHIQPARYDVAIDGARGELVDRVSATGARAQGSEVDISAGGAVRLTITISNRAERIDGTALRDGKPFAGAMIVLVPEDFEHNRSRVRRDQSDSDGTFSLYNVLPGEYTVVALAKGWDLDWQGWGVLEPYLKLGTPITVGSYPVPPIKVTVE